jgi:acylphosphatase
MSDDIPGEVALVARVTGRVQGVAYRAWTRDEALVRGLSGWVRNLPDGSVSALLCGPADAVHDMVAAMRRGPPAARVADVRTMPAGPPDAPGFGILR